MKTTPQHAEKVNTLTLASLLRKGMVTVQGKQKLVRKTSLGEQAYKYNMTSEILAWKDQLAMARDIKGVKARKRKTNGKRTAAK